MKTILLVAFLSIACFGQAALQDAQGKSGIYSMDGGGNFKINFSEASATLAYSTPKDTHKVSYGISVSSKSNEGVASLVSEGKLVPTISASLIIRYRGTELDLNQTTDKGDHYFYLEVAPTYSQFKTIDTAKELPKQIEKTRSVGFSSATSWVYRFHNMVTSCRLQAENSSNYSDLSSVRIVDEEEIFTDSTSRRYISKVGDYRLGAIKNSWGFSARADAVFVPDLFGNRIGFNYNLRLPEINESLEFTNGFGVLLTEKDNPTQVVGGVSVAFRDNKMSTGLVAGYNF